MRGAVLSTVLAASLAGCGSSDASGSGGNAIPGDALATARANCVTSINAYRATIGVPAYLEWSDAWVCTDGQAETDSATMAPHQAFGACGELAQDECPGWPGPPETMISMCLDQMWAEGPGTDYTTHGHYLNMSATAYTEVACGFYVLPDGSVWATQNFK